MTKFMFGEGVEVCTAHSNLDHTVDDKNEHFFLGNGPRRKSPEAVWENRRHGRYGAFFVQHSRKLGERRGDSC